jgi:hypothetical protein
MSSSIKLVNAWISKYALTKGIFQVLNAEIFEEQILTFHYGDVRNSIYGKGKTWHLTLEGAQARAEEMRIEKIKSLKKQIKKLEAMTF